MQPPQWMLNKGQLLWEEQQKSDGTMDAGGGTGPTDSRTLSEGAQQDHFRKWVKKKSKSDR